MDKSKLLEAVNNNYIRMSILFELEVCDALQIYGRKECSLLTTVRYSRSQLFYVQLNNSIWLGWASSLITGVVYIVVFSTSWLISQIVFWPGTQRGRLWRVLLYIKWNCRVSCSWHDKHAVVSFSCCYRLTIIRAVDGKFFHSILQARHIFNMWSTMQYCLQCK